MRYLATLLFFFFGTALYAQDVSDLSITALEDSLQNKLDDLRAAKTNAQKKIANIKLSDWVEKTIWRTEAFEHPFDSLKTMGTITSPDNKFRLFNWNIENDDGTFSYYCYVVKHTSSRKKNHIIKLVDKSQDMRQDPTELTMDNNNWYGCLYFKIIPVKKGNKQLYTLLGWDGNDRLSTKKLIDVMYFQGSRRIKFGYPIFKAGNTIQNRYFLEFMSDQYVSVKHHTKKKTDYIVFDHLSPKAPQLEGVYEHYVVDGSYDAFRFEDNYWILTLDVDQRNPAEKKKYNNPEKDNYNYNPKKFEKKKISK